MSKTLWGFSFEMDRQKKRGETECILGIGWGFIVIGAPRLDENFCVGVGGLDGGGNCSSYSRLGKAAGLEPLPYGSTNGF